MPYLTISRLIPSGPLHIFDELAHKDLQTWSRELWEGLRPIEPYAQDAPAETPVYLNQAALVAALSGNTDHAFDLCKAQVHWLLRRKPAQSMDISDFTTLFQPLINIGRLHSIRNDHEGAAMYFGMIDRINHEEEIDLIYDSIKSDQIKGYLKDEKQGPGLENFMMSNYIDGVFKVFMMKHQYQKALQFMEEKGQLFNSPEFQEVKVESILLVLETIGEHKAALKLIKAHKPVQAISKLIFLYHLSLNHYLSGDMENAFKYAIRLSGYLLKATKKANFIELKKLLLLTAQLCREIDMNKNALQLNQHGYNLSKEWEDQRYALLFAIDIHQSYGISEEQRESWMAEIEKLMATNDYRLPVGEKYLNLVEREPVTHDYFMQMYNLVQEKFAA